MVIFGILPVKVGIYQVGVGRGGISIWSYVPDVVLFDQFSKRKKKTGTEKKFVWRGVCVCACFCMPACVLDEERSRVVC